MKILNLFKKDLIGIDIGEHSIKLVEGYSDSSKIYIKRLSNIPTPFNSFINGEIANAEEIASAIKSGIESSALKSKKLSFTVDNKDIVERYIELPTVDKKQIKKMLEFEIPQQMPISMKESVVQTRIVSQTNSKEVKKSSVLVVSMNKNTVKSYISLSDNLESTPYALDTIYDGIDKLLGKKPYINHQDCLKENTAAFIDIGFSTINVNLYKNSRFEFNKIIELGSKDIDMNIANLLKIELSEAKAKKESIVNINESNTGEREDLINTVVKSTLDSWASEINKVFKYFISREFGNEIDRIYIYGGGAKINGLDRYLEDYFGISTSHISHIGNIVNETDSEELPFFLYLNAITALIRLR